MLSLEPPRNCDPQELYEYAVELYAEKGQAAVMKLGRQRDLPFAECDPCDSTTPHLMDGVCLVCGTQNPNFDADA